MRPAYTDSIPSRVSLQLLRAAPYRRAANLDIDHVACGSRAPSPSPLGINLRSLYQVKLFSCTLGAALQPRLMKWNWLYPSNPNPTS